MAKPRRSASARKGNLSRSRRLLGAGQPHDLVRTRSFAILPKAPGRKKKIRRIEVLLTNGRMDGKNGRDHEKRGTLKNTN